MSSPSYWTPFHIHVLDTLSMKIAALPETDSYGCYCVHTETEPLEATKLHKLHNAVSPPTVYCKVHGLKPFPRPQSIWSLQYQQQIETLRTALKEKTKENKRIKSSFGSIKELNYTMKKQLDDVTEQNRRLENQSRKVQARLDNLQVTDDVPTVMLLVHLKVSMLPKRRLKTCRAETVGIVTQATDVLHDDVGMEDGKAFFLKYQALAVILAVLRAGNPSLQVRAMDILLQMGAESRDFLQACSTEQFFRWASTFLRSTRLDLTLAEKLSILLQKLSGIRSNKRLFEAFSLHLLLQEMHRTTNPAHAFLTINLSSILLNLGMPTRP
uniref:Uncharacterized protein n=1 Tax=Electrophorus electricus TaxID=8005 RepID=A0A4W4FDT1_ELEEL